jgi:hypothetical protein
VQLNNRVLERFSPEERNKIGVHTCPGGDQDSTHSADVDYALLLPALFGTLRGSTMKFLYGGAGTVSVRTTANGSRNVQLDAPGFGFVVQA